MIDAQDRVSSKSEELSPAKRALLELRLKQKGRLNSYDLIPRRDPSGPALLSFTQELLWLQDQLVPGPAYNVPRVWRIRGDIDVPALTATLRDLVFRHEVLRTRFVIAEGHPVQIIDEDVVPVLERIDLQSLPAENHEHQVMEYIRERANCIFDLAEGPLMKSSLLQLGPQEYVLMLVTHHIASDGWSRDVLFRELAELYDAHHTGRLPQVPDLPIQYADFAAWQRNVMQGAVVQSHLDYWKRQLAGAPALLELPTDYPRPAVQTYHGNSVRKLLLAPSELSDLKALGRESKTTLFMTTLACAMALLYRHTGQTDILIATPISGRNHAETENLLGYFMNMLVLRIRLSGEMTFRNLLQQVRQVTLEAFEHQFVPYEKLFMELNPERSPSYNPLFQVVFGFGQAASAPLNLTGLTTTTLIVDRGVAKFDLTISTSEAETGLLGTLEYNTDLFTPETIARMMDRHERLIKGVLANPDATIAELPLLSDTERKQLLVEWNDTCVEYPEATNLMELFEAQVSRTPNAIAVEYAGRKLTYAEVNLQANQLAYYLRRCEVGPEVPVGILIERSAELIVGLLGILKAGGAYVPLDENYPPERIRHILQRAQIPVVVTHQALSKSLDGYEGRIVCLDQEAQQLTQESRQNPSPTAEADSLAYVMFTSGSTGEPKGIAVPHTALMHFVRAAGDLYTLKPTDRVLQFASIGFDTSIEEIFPCLTIGATLVMRTCEMLDTQALFWQLCEDWGITMLSLPTAFWHELTRTANFKAMVPEALRLVVLGGEKARADRLAIWQDQVGPRIQLLNTYGPTETTVVATACDITAPVSGEIPIGRPISNVRVYLLDGLGQLVPRGSVGEITIGGAGVARGYLHDAERTEACFVPDPFVPEGRLYKTGDLGRYAADGNIEFL
ncbi:MAG: amino acid adenylation protein, partial [Chthonomonadales bacterium]|nr:amino acid adenylation protein [Chthonomonadales bacterium]